MKKRILTLVTVLGLFAAKAKADSFNYGIRGDAVASFGGYALAGSDKGAKMVLPNWDAGITLGMDFGDDGQEMAGFYFDLGYGMRSITSEEIGKAEVNLKAVAGGLGGKFMPVYFDGGDMYIKAGADGYFSFDTEGKGTEVKKDKIQPLNVAGKIEFGVDLLDGGMSVGLVGRLWFMNINGDSASKAKIGAGQVDGGLSLGLNIAKLVE